MKPFILIQYLLPQHLLSRLVGILAQTKINWIKNTFIQWFIKRYQVNMEEAINKNPCAYENFNDFFTRELKPGVRDINQDPNGIACPVDGAVSEIGQIEEDNVYQAKNHYYSLTDLLGGDKNDAGLFTHGSFATLYLSPKDYHRIHMPIAGTLKKMIYVPGKLFSVNTLTTEHVTGLFARNERVVCLFDTQAGPMAMILVGAMIVASIKTSWYGMIAPNRNRQIQTWEYQNNPIYLEKGAEMGQFLLGSTVILLHANEKITWENALKANSPIKLGQLIGEIH